MIGGQETTFSFGVWPNEAVTYLFEQLTYSILLNKDALVATNRNENCTCDKFSRGYVCPFHTYTICVYYPVVVCPPLPLQTLASF